LNKLRRTVVESSKQSGRNRLMEIAEPLAARDYFRTPSSGSIRWLAHPVGSQGDPTLISPAKHNHGPLDPVYLAVGPEGGFSVPEVDAAGGDGWQIVSLGPRILRIETAAIALASLVACADCDFLARNPFSAL
jgi:16S rRNA (uracil1498-N3)-methyltransferase